jgi:hypothetical protein
MNITRKVMQQVLQNVLERGNGVVSGEPFAIDFEGHIVDIQGNILETNKQRESRLILEMLSLSSNRRTNHA